MGRSVYAFTFEARGPWRNSKCLMMKNYLVIFSLVLELSTQRIRQQSNLKQFKSLVQGVSKPRKRRLEICLWFLYLVNDKEIIKNVRSELLIILVRLTFVFRVYFLSELSLENVRNAKVFKHLFFSKLFKT